MRLNKLVSTILPATLALLAFVLIAKFNHQNKRAAKNAELTKIESKLTKANSFVPSEREHDLSSVLLTDSILSIIQSYYVDAERVDNNRIIEFTLKSLDAEGFLTYKKNGIKVELKSQKNFYNIFVPEKIQYDSMLEIMVGLGHFLDQSNSSGTVTIGNAKTENSGAKIVLNSLLLGLDAHSALLSKDSYRELRQGTEGTFGGLGVLVGIRNQVLTVIKPLPRSPAFRNGVKRNDKIISIDGVDTFGYTLDQLVEYMRGDPGTEVDLTLLRPGAESPQKYLMNREVIRVDSVTSFVHKQSSGPVLRLVIENFSTRTSREVLSAIGNFRNKHNGVLGGLILDLRSNPGGLLDQSVQVADLFLQSGVIVTTKGRRQEIESAGKGYDEIDYPIMILTNGDSASASEIVAGALQDHGRALVIGQPSFGKGSVQTVFELPGEQALKLTIARYYTPSGRSIQNVGITPDIWIQPVFPEAENSNLLGSYRYKNERFLANHLSSGKSGKFRGMKTIREPVLGYFLAKYSSTDDEIPIPKDIDLDLAMTVIKKVNEIYGENLPDSAGRASHWMALASTDVKKKMKKWDKNVSSYLKKSFNVNWKKGKNVDGNSLVLSMPGKIKKAVLPGQMVKIPFRIANPTRQSINQVSIFVRAISYGIEAKELLIGSIDGGKTFQGSVGIKIPTYWESGPITFEAGLATSAELTNVPMKRVAVQVNPRSTPVLLPIVELLGEVGGKVTGSLEVNESAKISVLLKNDSKNVASNLRVKLLNFSGSQVILDQRVKPISKILPGKSRRVEFKITATDTLKTVNLGFGLSVEGDVLEMPLREKIDLKAIPSPVSRVSNFIAH